MLAPLSMADRFIEAVLLRNAIEKRDRETMAVVRFVKLSERTVQPGPEVVGNTPEPCGHRE
jgi:hypothetical protein